MRVLVRALVLAAVRAAVVGVGLVLSAGAQCSAFGAKRRSVHRGQRSDRNHCGRDDQLHRDRHQSWPGRRHLDHGDGAGAGRSRVHRGRRSGLDVLVCWRKRQHRHLFARDLPRRPGGNLAGRGGGCGRGASVPSSPPSRRSLRPTTTATRTITLSSTAQIPAPYTDLGVQITGPEQAVADPNVTYTVTATNGSAVDAPNAAVSFSVPSDWALCRCPARADGAAPRRRWERTDRSAAQ